MIGPGSMIENYRKGFLIQCMKTLITMPRKGPFIRRKIQLVCCMCGTQNLPGRQGNY